MSTGILYHGFGVRGYVHESTLYVGGEGGFWIRQEPESWRCSACGSPQVIGRGKEVRGVRCLPPRRNRGAIWFAASRGGRHRRGGGGAGRVPLCPRPAA